MKRCLGVCYYPEQWPRNIWETDAQNMKRLGISWVRIAEFSWAKIEPQPYIYNFEWLDEVIDIMGKNEIKIVLGTPTAAPPRWMVDLYPDMLPVEQSGISRQFGSRRHYCFSHEKFVRHCELVVEIIAKRYGRNPNIKAWQIDNEYGCHDTTISYSAAALNGYQKWLKYKFSHNLGKKCNPIDNLNHAWGNNFWSMTYASFDQIGFPINCVTDPNPAHSLSFLEYCSEKVAEFNKRQALIIKKYSSSPITHNFMGKITEFDHFKVSDNLDFASWDSYPLGFLEDRISASESHRITYARQGDPDFQAFHHDLYRAVGNGRWWVMEQQPGSVNWAPFNPMPLEGMVRVWTWEAFAHGAEVVSFFRWRQAKSAQEQLHSGLQCPAGKKMPVTNEIQKISSELKNASEVKKSKSQIGIVFDYESERYWRIQPHGKGNSYFDLVFDFYRGLRKLGQSIDFISPNADSFDGYKLILIPGAMFMENKLVEKINEFSHTVLVGPRAGCRDRNFNLKGFSSFFPRFDLEIIASETFRPETPVRLSEEGCFVRYRELISTSAKILMKTESGDPALISNGNIQYLAGWPDESAMKNIFLRIFEDEKLSFKQMPEGIRERRNTGECFWFNYNDFEVEFEGFKIPSANFIRRELK